MKDKLQIQISNQFICVRFLLVNQRVYDLGEEYLKHIIWIVSHDQFYNDVSRPSEMNRLALVSGFI